MNNIEYNERSTVLKDIVHINFTNLTYLQLGGNQIESIEGLPRVQMPHIQHLFLCTRLIIQASIASLQYEWWGRQLWPTLQFLDISKQWIMQDKTISGMGKVWQRAASSQCKYFPYTPYREKIGTNLPKSVSQPKCKPLFWKICVPHPLCRHPGKQILLWSFHQKSPWTKVATW